MTFFKQLEDRARAEGTLLCVGLDPVSARDDDAAACADMLEQNRRLIGQCARFAACFKPNVAFYEARGAAGIDLLHRTLDLVPGEVPVILDAKRCDIDSTGAAYAKALFGRTSAGAVTISSYMGFDAALPFLEYEGRCVFMLCRTSNPGALELQGLKIGGRPLYERVARSFAGSEPLASVAPYASRVGLVVAGNDPGALAATRAAAKDAWFLAPGIGAQGGQVEPAIDAGLRADGLGILPVVARAIAKADDPGAAARDFRDRIEKARQSAGSNTRCRGAGSSDVDPLKERVFRGLVEAECFKTGRFTLKSGKISPFYVDLRRVVSDPALLDAVADAYVRAIGDVEYDRIAGIPVAALPLATAVSLKTGKPLVYPRLSAKDHGTGNRVEGGFRQGERVLLLDDLITTGLSKLEALEVLRSEGLVVERLVVLLERGRQGRKDMEAAGVRLSSFAHVRELFATCERMGLIDANGRSEMEAWVDAE